MKTSLYLIKFDVPFLAALIASFTITLKVIPFSLQKEIALYTASKVTSEFLCFDIDGDIDPMFKVIFLS